jgi:hypothetical protein
MIKNHYSRKTICKFLKITPEDFWEIIEKNRIPVKVVKNKKCT